MSFPTYTNYRDSGVEWIGQIPEDWNVFRVAHVAKVINGFPFDSGLFTDTSGLPLMRIRDLNSVKTECRYAGETVPAALITSNDLLIGMDGDFNVGRWLGDGPALLNQRVCCLRADHRLSRWLEYALPSPLKRINDVTYSTTVKHLSSRDIETVRLTLPPTSAEVDCILAILDQETAKIDNLIAEQEHLVALSEEKQQAVILHVVMKGLDADAPMMESGVDWLGAVPSSWRVIRLGALYREVSESGNGDLPILSVSIHSGVTDRELNDDELDRMVVRSEDKTKYKSVKPGDLVYNMMRAWQGGFGTVKVAGMVSPAYVVARPTGEARSEYVEYLLKTQRAIALLRGYSKGVTDFRLRLYWDEFKQIKIALPPTSEQNSILRAIADLSSRINSLILQSMQAVALLRERRAALISAAVTGKIDVRGLADTNFTIQVAAE